MIEMVYKVVADFIIHSKENVLI